MFGLATCDRREPAPKFSRNAPAASRHAAKLRHGKALGKPQAWSTTSTSDTSANSTTCTSLFHSLSSIPGICVHSFGGGDQALNSHTAGGLLHLSWTAHDATAIATRRVRPREAQSRTTLAVCEAWCKSTYHSIPTRTNTTLLERNTHRNSSAPSKSPTTSYTMPPDPRRIDNGSQVKISLQAVRIQSLRLARSLRRHLRRPGPGILHLRRDHIPGYRSRRHPRLRSGIAPTKRRTEEFAYYRIFSGRR